MQPVNLQPDAVMSIWSKISEEHFVESLPRRTEAVLKEKWTNRTNKACLIKWPVNRWSRCSYLQYIFKDL